MTKRKKTKTSLDSVESAWKFKGYLDLALTAQDKEDIKGFTQTERELMHTMRGLGESGYKTSVNFSKKLDLWLLSITGKDTWTDDDGYTLTIRHRRYDRIFEILGWFTTNLPEGESLFEVLHDKDIEDW